MVKHEIRKVCLPRVIPSLDSMLGMSGDLRSMILEFNKDKNFVLTYSQKAASSVEWGNNTDNAIDVDNDNAMSQSML